MKKINDITGVILAGGKSSRFGRNSAAGAPGAESSAIGRNKAFALLEGAPLIERVLEVMQLTFRKVIIVTNTPADFAHLKVLVLTDSIPNLGPLGGIMTALQHTTDDGIFAVGCDMPLLNSFVIRQIVKERKNHLAVVPEHDGIREYLMAFYSKKLTSTMAPLLEQGRLSIAEMCGLLTNILWVPVQGASWKNVNTKKELESISETQAHGSTSSPCPDRRSWTP